MKHKLSSLSGDIVQPEQLLERANANRLFIDVRLGEPEDEFRDYRDCHILGAVYGQIREVFAAQPAPDSGNLPLPEREQLEHRLRAWGVDAETEVVVYGPSVALAARGWWVLRWAGLKNVKVLDGGLEAWINHGGPVAQGETHRVATAASEQLRLQPGNMPQILVDEVEQLGSGTLLIDARDENSFLAGSIPRARNLPSAEQWTPAGVLRTVSEIESLYEDAGVKAGRDVVVYCGGGVLSALSVLTLNALGVEPRLYVGSWSEWNKSPERMARSAAERGQA
ncbi:rhodanese-like domain-containing protein [Pigmentiphaga sp. GD03639]|jgi:thiosulfate/3-mercaptopyruvate sulfurtransferase|uniref:Sulfurtransferase n=1 Tax=Pigmentiphaga daeguensis TaxID=414049 RepID=A0ABN1BKW3_9BURK|nr:MULTISPECIES: rhodanese-like domain-containing protein [unclassified Pigmentiphaga]MDH2234962.1 rhodanese-like domain-containing protein [Pigmentiphaga sp. GD03639]